ncbi:MAG: hypothetical protein SF028_10245 [Candidatus Sumerlaeia bacterium]|nr:hypothetical protein [Candidatus Sumerlaeia bacterium]
MTPTRFLAALLIGLLFLAGCGETKREQTLAQDREQILNTARGSAERVQQSLARTEEENRKLSSTVQTLSIAMERQQESVDQLRFAVQTLNEQLNTIESEITAREKAEAESGGFGKYLTGFLLIVVILAIVGAIFFLLRSKSGDEDDDDFASLDDDMEFDEGIEDDFEKKDDKKDGGEKA